MQKIAILAFNSESVGGVYQYTESMIDALKDNEDNKYVIFCNEDDKRFDSFGLEVRKTTVKQNNIVKTVRALQHLFMFRKPLFFTKEEKNIFEDIDIFISPAISAYPHFYLKKPFIFTLHDMQERYYPNFFTLKDKITRWLNNKALAKSADKIICESNYVKNDIVKFIKIDENKVSIIQSPPPQKFLEYDFNGRQKEMVIKKYKLPKKYIFYPAQAWFHKNHIKLIEAFKIINEQYPDVYLILTGSQKNNYKNIVNKIVELNLQNRVIHLGYIDYEDLPYLYKLSQFLVMPTLFESVSIPIYEAFALEVAVCSSNAVALPEQVGDAGLLFDPNDIDDMAKNMMMYLDDEELRREKAQKGYEKVKHFNHNEYRKKLLNDLGIY